MKWNWSTEIDKEKKTSTSTTQHRERDTQLLGERFIANMVASLKKGNNCVPLWLIVSSSIYYSFQLFFPPPSAKEEETIYLKTISVSEGVM